MLSGPAVIVLLLESLYYIFNFDLMITALTALLVLISLGLVVTVPVALATPGEWESSSNFTKGIQAWVALILIIAASDGIAASI
jgi:photosystem II core protein PsbZ